MTVAKKCDTTYRACHDSGPRRVPIKYLVIHSTESPNTKGAAKRIAQYFSRPVNNDIPPSTQLTVDDLTCYRSVPDNVIPWAAPPFNSAGLHIEQVGYARWSRAEWMQHRATIDNCAYHVALWATAYKIPIRWLSPNKCKNYLPGITSHRNVSLAFHKSDHSDPGPEGNKNYPYDYFMAKVKTFAAIWED